MDDIDVVQEIFTNTQENMLAERRLRMEREAQIKAPDHRECADCGVDIPAARLRLKPLTRRCVECQADIERAVA